jgi:latrophilin 1
MVYNDINDLLDNKKIKLKNEDVEETTNSINTNIISFQMNTNDMKYLTEVPVELTFMHLNNNFPTEKYYPTCSYWYYDKVTFEGEWKTDGCSIKATNQTHTICSCNHLTHFAVLMDIHGVYEKVFSFILNDYLILIILI